jgi:hypothetical protein
MKVKDLEDECFTPGPHRFLLCRKCGGEYSAHKGDYFMSSPDKVLKCCKVNLLRVMKQVTFVKA